MAQKKNDLLWQQFEKAVHRFVQQRLPLAKVIFNHKVIDKDTGKTRQCDAWINMSIGEHWPISILVSCKRHNRKLDVGHIGTFVNEIGSTGASTGVIYSYKGFTKPAILKAKANGISCCRLFSNEPGEMPDELLLQVFVCKPSIHLCLLNKANDADFQKWAEVFSLSAGDHLLVDDIEIIFHEQEQISVLESNNTGNFPQDWAVEVSYPKLTLRILCAWKIYEHESKFNLLDGSLSYTNSNFQGKLTTPAFNFVDAHPGAGWKQVEPAKIILKSNRAILTTYRGKIKDALLESASESNVVYCG